MLSRPFRGTLSWNICAGKTLMYNGSVLKILPTELVPVDRVLQRWSVSIGDAIREEWDEDKRKSLPPPLPDDLAIIVDQTILRSPEGTRRFLRKWYKSPEPTYVIAEAMRMKPEKIIRYWKVILIFMRYKLESSKNPDLLHLLGVRV